MKRFHGKERRGERKERKDLEVKNERLGGNTTSFGLIVMMERKKKDIL